MAHSIDPQVVDLIEILAEQSPDVKSGDATREEVLDCWMNIFHEHAAAAVLAANEKAALHCEARAVQEEERSKTVAWEIAEFVHSRALLCHTLAAEIRLLRLRGKT